LNPFSPGDARPYPSSHGFLQLADPLFLGGVLGVFGWFFVFFVGGFFVGVGFFFYFLGLFVSFVFFWFFFWGFFLLVFFFSWLCSFSLRFVLYLVDDYSFLFIGMYYSSSPPFLKRPRTL